MLPVSTFVDRPNLHKKLKAEFNGDISQARGHDRIVVVHGAGGVGKSQLVLSFVQLHRGDYRAVFWIETATKAAVERDFVQIYLLLYEVSDVAGLQPTRAEDAVPAVKRWFYGQQKRWLLIFDSAEYVDLGRDPASVNLRYFLSDDSSVDVIITARNTDVKKIFSRNGIGVAEMTSEKATTLFLNEAERKAVTTEQRAEVASIVEEFGYLALAVSLAGAYVAATPRLAADITQYLLEYRRRRRELLDQKSVKLVHQYSTSVLTTWETLYAAVQRRDTCAGQFLSLFGWLHWEDIFVSLFEVFDRSSVLQDEKAAQSVWVLFPTGDIDLYRIEIFFTILRTYSLVKFHADTSSYSMHQLIHA